MKFSKMDVTSSLATRNADCIPLIEIKRNFFKNNFFPSTIIEWNKLDAAIGNAESLDIFKNNILKFFRPTPRSFFNYYNHKGIRLMSRPLGEWVVYVNINSITIFKTVLIPFVVVVWISNQRLTFSPLFDDKRIALLNTLNKIDCKLIVAMESSLIETLVFGIHCLIWKKNSLILSYASIDYILSTKRFEEALLQQVLITTTKCSCRSNHSFILSEFFNVLYLYLDLLTFTFFCYSQALLEFFGARWL